MDKGTGSTMDEISNSAKVTILLNILGSQIGEIQRREEREQQIFLWATSLLLAVFGAILALSDKTNQLAYPTAMKLLITAMVTIPISLFIRWLFRFRTDDIKNTEIIERIEKLLHLFESGHYGEHSPLPEHWLGRSRRLRRTPLYYAATMLLMTACVIVAIWLVF